MLMLGHMLSVSHVTLTWSLPEIVVQTLAVIATSTDSVIVWKALSSTDSQSIFPSLSLLLWQLLHPLVSVASILYLIFSLSSFGLMFERNPVCLRLEVARLAVLLFADLVISSLSTGMHNDIYYIHWTTYLFAFSWPSESCLISFQHHIHVAPLYSTVLLICL